MSATRSTNETERNSSRRIRSLSLAGMAGAASFLLSTISMHWIQPGLNPSDVAVSYYMNGRLGWLLGLSLVMLGLGSIAEAAAIRRLLKASSRASRLGSVALAIWGVGCAIAGIFPPGPLSGLREPPSATGVIHAVAAITAFLAFPPAAILLSGVLRKCVGLDLRALAWASAISLVAFFGSILMPTAPRWLGLAERVLLVVYTGWLAAAAMAVCRAAAHLGDSRGGLASLGASSSPHAGPSGTAERTPSDVAWRDRSVTNTQNGPKLGESRK